eukprot:10502818-Alexandrium_andersonii.AAC.1
MAELLATRRREDVCDQGKELSRPGLSTGSNSARRPDPFNAAGRLGGTGAPSRAGRGSSDQWCPDVGQVGDKRHGHDSGLLITAPEGTQQSLHDWADGAAADQENGGHGRSALVLPAVDSAPIGLGDARPAGGAAAGRGTARSVLAQAFAVECVPACEAAPAGLLLFLGAKGADGSVRPGVRR